MCVFYVDSVYNVCYTMYKRKTKNTPGTLAEGKENKMRKNIYIKDEDQELFKKAEALGGGNFSAMIAKAARHFVEVEEAKERRMNKIKNENKELLTLLENDNNFRFEVKHAILSHISTIEKRINSIKEMRHQDEFTADTVRHYQDISLKNLNKFLVLLDEI
jgi:hypothetical protein